MGPNRAKRNLAAQLARLELKRLGLNAARLATGGAARQGRAQLADGCGSGRGVETRVVFRVGGEGAAVQVGRACVTRVVEVWGRLGFVGFDGRRSTYDGAAERAAGRRGFASHVTAGAKTIQLNPQLELGGVRQLRGGCRSMTRRPQTTGDGATLDVQRRLRQLHKGGSGSGVRVWSPPSLFFPF